MQKLKAKIPVLFIVITAIAACVLHLFQFLSEAGEPVARFAERDSVLYLIYALVFAGAVFCAVYAGVKKNSAKTFDFGNRKNSIFLSSVLLAATFFFDFVHQGYNCYDYVQSVSFIEYTYLVPLGASGLFALASSFYFITLAMTARNANYDFRNFTLLHFVPVVWAFSKLFGIMIKIVDIRDNMELCCEFILLCVILYFMFSMISAVDKKDAPATKSFVFSSVMLAFMAFLVGIPRMIMLLLGKGELISSVSFSSCTYIMLGVFALALLCDVNKRTVQNN